MANDLQELERKVKRILDECRSDIRSWNELDANHRWARINSATDDAKREIIKAIRDAWNAQRETG